MKLLHYDSEQFKKRFISMSDQELMASYADVCNRIDEANDMYSSGQCSEDEFFAFLDDALLLQDYVGRYLAGLYIQEHGYSYTDEGKFLPCST